MRGFWLVGVTCLLLVCWAAWATPSQEQADSEVPEAALEAMHGFLRAWLVEQDKAKAVAHFSASYRSQEVAPRAVWTARNDSNRLAPVQQNAYWGILERLSGAQHEGSLRDIVAALDPDLMEILHLSVRIVETEPFTVFVAEDDVAIDSFDGGYGDVATVLQPAENLVLTMIVDFADRQREGYSGPFVSFWTEEADGWHIQALGAVPNEETWLDGEVSAR